MGMIVVEEIIGYHFDHGEYVCCKCASEAEDQDALEHEIITLDDVEGDERRYFCGRCKDRFGS